ncbi:hypothetical protein DFH09DRAFT_1301081 [Mycena vulgaris]|nr:hypothetical protein DFH09DRAFT_1301081 [Mycena vulgaris]
MLFRAILCLSAATLAIAAPAQAITYVRVFHTITDVAPYIVEGTTTMVFTPSPSTIVVDPTGPGTAV